MDVIRFSNTERMVHINGSISVTMDDFEADYNIKLNYVLGDDWVSVAYYSVIDKIFLSQYGQVEIEIQDEGNLAFFEDILSSQWYADQLQLIADDTANRIAEASSKYSTYNLVDVNTLTNFQVIEIMNLINSSQFSADQVIVSDIVQSAELQYILQIKYNLDPSLFI